MKRETKQEWIRKRRRAVRRGFAGAAAGMIFAAGICGCKEAAGENSPVTLSSAPFSSEALKGETKGETEEETPAEADLLWRGAGLSGSVMEFSDGGCSISPTKSEGDLAWSAAEGHESEGEIVQVLYSEDCVFRIANVDIITAKASYEPASREDVKKQTSVILYGDYDGDGKFRASRVYIYRGTEG
ncbi:MAG: hypothetical protein HFI68_07415 [Lachnospiraceae bacterium]|nr:hypothetical protein [Lachnospiraceae bacterium]